MRPYSPLLSVMSLYLTTEVIFCQQHFFGSFHMWAFLGNPEYDLDVERKRAEEKAGGKPWIRSFPHERGNWPTYVYIPGDVKSF